MTLPTETWAPGMEHLLVESEGGIELPSLFGGILYTLHQEGTITIARARKAIERTHANHFRRMRKLYHETSEDGVDACLRAVLGQMTQQQLLEAVAGEDGVWRAGPAFALDQKMHVVTGTSGHCFTVVIPSTVDTTPSVENMITQVHADLRALAQRLLPRGEGLRPVTREGVETIKKSLLDHGLMPGYPLLYDQHGRLLGGRQRRQAEAELKAAGLWDGEWGETWPTQTIEVSDDRQALGIAMAGNYARRWTADDFRRLEKAGLGSTKRDTLRRILELMFIEDPNRSVEKTAMLLSCSPQTARKVREVLQQKGHIEVSAAKPGPAPDLALRDRIRAAWLAHPQATQQGIAAEAGCSHTHAGNVRKELEDEGVLQPRSVGGTKGRPRAPRDDLREMYERITQELERDIHQTNVAIASLLGTDESVVRRWRKKLEGEGRIAARFPTRGRPPQREAAAPAAVTPEPQAKDGAAYGPQDDPAPGVSQEPETATEITSTTAQAGTEQRAEQHAPEPATPVPVSGDGTHIGDDHDQVAPDVLAAGAPDDPNGTSPARPSSHRREQGSGGPVPTGAESPLGGTSGKGAPGTRPTFAFVLELARQLTEDEQHKLCIALRCTTMLDAQKDE